MARLVYYGPASTKDLERQLSLSRNSLTDAAGRLEAERLLDVVRYAVRVAVRGSDARGIDLVAALDDAAGCSRAGPVDEHRSPGRRCAVARSRALSAMRIVCVLQSFHIV